MKITAVIVAGGKGARMGADINKVFLPIAGKEVLYYTVNAFEKCPQVSEIVLVTGKEDMERRRLFLNKYGFKKITAVTEGGASRQQSVLNGLAVSDADIVLIHDGARALVTGNEITAAISDCIKYGAAAAGVSCKDTLKSADSDGFIAGTIDRETTYMIQTPQAFHLGSILTLHQKAAAEGFTATDDCMIAERYGERIKISAGSYENIKLTTPEDMLAAEKILRKRGEID